MGARRWAFVLGLVFALAGLGADVAPAASPAGGAIEIFVTPNGGAVYKILVVGAIGDHGTATSIDKDGKVDSNGNYVRIKLSKGTFEVNSAALNTKVNNAPPLLASKATCTYVFGGSGPVTVFNGSGLYAGITGTLQITETFAGQGPLYQTGAKKGQCNTGNSAQPVASWSAITGKGTIKYA
jgi:hypothetical protein